VNNELFNENEEASTPNQPQTENMEVHHHPDLHHEKKNFREYFLEFLMIFLAVTMGFFAESLRENISNNERAKSLAQQLIKDIQADTANLNNVISYESVQQKRIDTLFLVLQKPFPGEDTKQIQQLVLIFFHQNFLSPIRVLFQQ
jgi:hypothetical protein